jgi:hypothetical protein
LTTEQELREKLRKIAALFEGATTSGERDAAAAALDRIRAALNAVLDIMLCCHPLYCFAAGPAQLGLPRFHLAKIWQSSA